MRKKDKLFILEEFQYLRLRISLSFFNGKSRVKQVHAARLLNSLFVNESIFNLKTRIFLILIELYLKEYNLEKMEVSRETLLQINSVRNDIDFYTYFLTSLNKKNISERRMLRNDYYK